MEVKERGKSIQVTAQFYDTNGILTEPTTPTITIYFEDGTAVVSAQSLTKQSTGIYYYYWDTATTLTIGVYIIEVSGTLGSRPVKNREPILIVEME